MQTFKIPMLSVGVEDGEPIAGSELDVTIEYSAGHVRVILGDQYGPDGNDIPDIYIERRGNNSFDVEIHDGPGDPTLIVEWREGTMEVFDGNGQEKYCTIENGNRVV